MASEVNTSSRVYTRVGLALALALTCRGKNDGRANFRSMLAQDVGALSNAFGRRALEVNAVLPRKGKDGRGPH